MGIIKLFYKKMNGEEITHQRISDIDFKDLGVKHPSELAANQPILQEMIRKHKHLVKWKK